MACCISSLFNCPTQGNQRFIHNRLLLGSALIGVYGGYLTAQYLRGGNAPQTINNSIQVLTNLPAQLIGAANARNLAAGAMIFAAFVVGALAITFLCNWISCCNSGNEPVTQPMTPAQIEAKRKELKAAITTARNSLSSEAAKAVLQEFEILYPEIIL